MKKVFPFLIAFCFLQLAHAQIQLESLVPITKYDNSDPRSKLRSSLFLLEQEYLEAMRAGISPEEFTSSQSLVMIRQGMVRIQASAQKDVRTMISGLEALGARQIDQYERVVNAWLPIERISQLPQVAELNFAKPVYWVGGDIGSATSEGDIALLAEDARDIFCVEGAGVRVGVISDSYTTRFPGGAAAGVASGDLPGVGNPNGYTTPVTVVADGDATNIDEGRAMCEIIHDLAPGAELFFNTANGGEASFATAIVNLDAVSNCDIIVDDIRYFEEPFYMDGPIALACNTVFNNGVPYFASAGNYGTSSYESASSNSGGALNAHDFDPGPGIDTLQSITVDAGSRINLTLQWDDPWGSLTPNSAATDLDVFLVNASGTVVASATDNNVGNDPTEFFSYTDPNASGTATYRILITRTAGPSTSVLKWVIRNATNLVINEYPPTTINALATGYGHSNAVGANAVAAAFWNNTPAYGVTPPLPEGFTSNGGVQIRYNTNGEPITPITRLKPNFCAVDGVSNTFFGTGNNFFGTSAAAPHAAAVAALMLEANPTLTPTQVRNLLVASSIEMLTPGFDYTTGSGLIQADIAVREAIELQCNISDIQVVDGPACEGKTYSVTLRISYNNPPDCDDVLVVNGETFPATGASFTDVTLTGLTPNGNAVSVTAYFESAPGCSRTVSNLYTAPNAPVGQNSVENIDCSGDPFSINLQSNILNGVSSDFTWAVSYNGLTGGNGPGSGDFINETLVNETGATASAVYTVTPTGTLNGCEGNPFTVTVTVPPALFIDAGENQTVYFGYPPAACATLSWSGASGGVPPYEISWSTGETTQSIEVCPMVTTTYTVTIKDANGCIFSDDVLVCAIDVRCGNKLNKVEICHVPPDNEGNPQTLCVGLPSVAFHLAHGDQLAACGTDHDCPPAMELREAPLRQDLLNTTELSAYPNPFSDQTVLTFSTQSEGQITLTLMDVTGRVIRTLFQSEVEPGQWYSVGLDASEPGSGMYFCLLQHSDGTVLTKKLVKN